jgi:uncharacterized membrane protein YwzB
LKQPKLNKYFNIFIRLGIVAGSVYFIANRIFNGDDFDKLGNVYKDLFHRPGFTMLICVLLLLMLVNWSLESFKWQQLVKQVEDVSFVRSFKAVLTGVTVSIFTPNRVGEYFGRAFILEKAEPMKGILLTIVGSMSQLMVTMIAGFLALLFFIPHYYPLNTDLHRLVFGGGAFFLLVFNIFLILLFLNVPTISRFTEWATRKRWAHVLNYLTLLENLSQKLLVKVLLLSCLRYLVFSIQFWLVLHVFGINLPVGQALMIIPIIYFVLSIIPTFALSELGVRGSIAIYLIGLFLLHSRGLLITAPESLAVLSATTAMWLINLALPALFGTFFVVNLRFFRK